MKKPNRYWASLGDFQFIFVNSTTKYMLNTVHSAVVRLFCLLAAWCPVLSPSVRPPHFDEFFGRGQKNHALAQHSPTHGYFGWVRGDGTGDCFSEWEKSGAKPHIIMFALICTLVCTGFFLSDCSL